MPYSGGAYSLVSGNPVVTGTAIASTWANSTLSDIASALSACVLKDGTQTITANIPMSGFKFTGLAAGTTSGDSLRYEQAIGVFLPLAGGTMTGNLLFTDATYDIGATGATRPRDLFLSRNAVVGGTLNVTGHVTLEGVTSTGATGTGLMVFGTAPTLINAVVGTQTASDNSTKAASTAYVDKYKGTLIGEQATTSGTSKDFTLSGALTEFTVELKGVSSNGTDNWLIQLGTGGTPTTSGYLVGSAVNGAATTPFTTGFGIVTASAAFIGHGSITFRLELASDNTWVGEGKIYRSDSAAIVFTVGRVSLAGSVDFVRLTTTGGTDTWDAGAANVLTRL